MDRFLQLFGRFVQFSYACWDRIVLRGYYPRLQRPENIVHFFQNVCDEARITPEVLASRTSSYRSWLESFYRAAPDPDPDGAEGSPQGGGGRSLLPLVQS